MSARELLVAAQRCLSEGRPKDAEKVFLQAWNHEDVTDAEREKALKGYCDALDAQGKYVLAETCCAAQAPLADTKRPLVSTR